MSEGSNGFPAHGLVDVKQRSLPAIEARILGHFSTEALPSALEIGQDGFLVAGRLGVKSHVLGQPFADNLGRPGCLQVVVS